MTTTQTSKPMNQNLKTFIAIFCFIWGVVGVVLCVVNLAQEPAATGNAVLFGALAMMGFVGGWLLTRKPRY